MFSTQHFIWLVVCAFVIFLIVFLNKKFKFTLRQNIVALFIVSVIAETFIIFSRMEYIEGLDFDTSGYYLSPEFLPLHLCGMQMLFVTALMFFIKKDSTRNALLCFMFPTTIIGAAFALLIPTSGVDFADPRVYEYFLFHSYLIGFGIYLITCKAIEFTFKDMFRNMLIMLGILVLGIYINSILSYGRFNFLFLSRPPMENLPILNTNHGWHVYFITLLGIGLFLLTVFQFPFAYCNYIKTKKVKSE